MDRDAWLWMWVLIFYRGIHRYIIRYPKPVKFNLHLDWILIYLNFSVNNIFIFQFLFIKKKKKSLTKNINLFVCLQREYGKYIVHTHLSVYIGKMWLINISLSRSNVAVFFLLLISSAWRCTTFTVLVLMGLWNFNCKLLKKENWPPQCVCVCFVLIGQPFWHQ